MAIELPPWNPAQNPGHNPEEKCEGRDDQDEGESQGPHDVAEQQGDPQDKPGRSGVLLDQFPRGEIVEVALDEVGQLFGVEVPESPGVVPDLLAVHRADLRGNSKYKTIWLGSLKDLR